MKVLVTGGAGFIGSRTVLRLLELGHECMVLDNLHPQIHTQNAANSPTWRAVRHSCTAIIADICDREAVRRALESCDAVLHLAAETGTGQSMYEVNRYVGTNVAGTAVLLELVAEFRERIRRVVVASSRSVYGEGSYKCTKDGTVTPNTRPSADMRSGRFEPRCPRCGSELTPVPTSEIASTRPTSVYAVTKLGQEQLVATVCSAAEVAWFALRYQNVYGPGQSLSNPYTGVLSIFSRLMLQNQPIEIFEDGNESRDFVYIDDVVAANVAALTAPNPISAIVNVGSGRQTSILDLVRLLRVHYDYGGEVSISGRFRAGDIRHNLADVTLATQVLGVRSTTTLEEGIATFCNWARLELAGDSHAGADYRRSLAELEDRGLIT
jgi:dTDP-L-rhamnose 4-epimerase